MITSPIRYGNVHVSDLKASMGREEATVQNRRRSIEWRPSGPHDRTHKSDEEIENMMLSRLRLARSPTRGPEPGKLKAKDPTKLMNSLNNSKYLVNGRVSTSPRAQSPLPGGTHKRRLSLAEDAMQSHRAAEEEDYNAHRHETRYKHELALAQKLRQDFAREAVAPRDPMKVLFPCNNPSSVVISEMRRGLSELSNEFIEAFQSNALSLEQQTQGLAAKEGELRKVGRELTERSSELEEVCMLNEVMGTYLEKLRDSCGEHGVLALQADKASRAQEQLMRQQRPSSPDSLGSLDAIEGMEAGGRGSSYGAYSTTASSSNFSHGAGPNDDDDDNDDYYGSSSRNSSPSLSFKLFEQVPETQDENYKSSGMYGGSNEEDGDGLMESPPDDRHGSPTSMAAAEEYYKKRLAKLLSNQNSIPQEKAATNYDYDDDEELEKKQQQQQQQPSEDAWKALIAAHDAAHDDALHDDASSIGSRSTATKRTAPRRVAPRRPSLEQMDDNGSRDSDNGYDRSTAHDLADEMYPGAPHNYLLHGRKEADEDDDDDDDDDDDEGEPKAEDKKMALDSLEAGAFWSFREAFKYAKEALSIQQTVLGAFKSNSKASILKGNATMTNSEDIAARENARITRKCLETIGLSKKCSTGLLPGELLKAITTIAESVNCSEYIEAAERMVGRGAQFAADYNPTVVGPEVVLLLAAFFEVTVSPAQATAVSKFLHTVDPKGRFHCRMLAKCIKLNTLEARGNEVLRAGKLLYVEPPLGVMGHADSLAVHNHEDVMLIAEPAVFPGNTWGPEERHKRRHRERQWNPKFAGEKHKLQLQARFKNAKEEEKMNEWERLGHGGWRVKIPLDRKGRPKSLLVVLDLHVPMTGEVARVLKHVVRYNTLHFIPLMHVAQKLEKTFPFGEMDNQSEVRAALKAAGLIDASLADGRCVASYLREVRGTRLNKKTPQAQRRTTLQGMSASELIESSRLHEAAAIGDVDGGPTDDNGDARRSGFAEAEKQVMMVLDLIHALLLVATDPRVVPGNMSKDKSLGH